jgi:hypothetical protein
MLFCHFGFFLTVFGTSGEIFYGIDANLAGRPSFQNFKLSKLAPLDTRLTQL